MTFGSPYLLLGLVAIPLAALGYWLLERRRARLAASWSTAAMLPNIVGHQSRRLGLVPAVLLLLGLTCLLVGFARPQRVLDTSPPGGPTVVLTFDTSGSMAAADVRPTRIRAARAAAVELLDELPAKYRVAVVTFADRSHVVLRPTLNRKLVISKLPTAVTPRAGTAIGDAINTSVALAVEAVGKGNPGSADPPAVVLLISDGAQTDGGTSPTSAAQTALVDGIPVDTIAVGTPNGVVTQPLKLNIGSTTVRIPVAVQTTTLQQVAQTSGGTYFRASSATQLSRVYDKLGTPTAAPRRRRELSAIAGALAVVFMVSGIVLSGLWFGRLA